MTFALTKKQVKELDVFRTLLQMEREQITKAFAQLLQALQHESGVVNELIELHNKNVQKAHDFVTDRAEEFREEWDGRTERWQESDAGQAAESFVSDWENSTQNPIELVRLVLPDAPQFDESLNMPEEVD